jgi:diguanylate cyclase
MGTPQVIRSRIRPIAGTLRPRPGLILRDAVPWLAWAGMVVGILGLATGMAVRGIGPPDSIYDMILYNLTYASGAVLCWRTTATGLARIAWRCTGIGLSSMTLANVYSSLALAPLTDPPNTWVANTANLAYYPMAYLTVIFLVRARVTRFHASMWLDGLVAGLGTAAIVVMLALGPTMRATGGGVTSVATNLAFPIADLVLLILLVGVSTALRLRIDRSFAWLGAGLVAFFIADVGFLLQDSSGQYASGGPLDAVWLLAVLAMAVGARGGGQVPPVVADPVGVDRVGWRVLGVPAAFHVISLGLLLAGWRYEIPLATGICAAGCVVAASLRAALTFREIQDLPEARRQARTDELTGIANRRGFYLRCDALLGGPLDSPDAALLLLDLDGFKEVNDSLGHHAGDELLAQVTQRLRPVIEPAGLLARLGGDEFAMLLPQATSRRAVQVADAVHAALAPPFTIDTVRLHIGGSIGVATTPAPAATRSDLLRCADIAMYQAKTATSDKVVVYTPEAHSSTGERLRTIEDLRTALTEGELLVHLQPQLDLTSGVVVGAEALVRWQHPARGLLPPAAFLEHADQAGLQRPLADAVIGLALGAAARWWRAGIRFPVSVNLSPANVTDLDLPLKIATALHRHGLPTSALTVELTEGTLMGDPERGRAVLRRLRDSGVGVSIDDYGTGYSSLAYLRDLPADELKLDRSFTADLDADLRVAAIVEHAVALAHALDLRLVAEGVESAAAAAALGRLGCDVGQGFHLCRPLPEPEFHAWLAGRSRP